LAAFDAGDAMGLGETMRPKNHAVPDLFRDLYAQRPRHGAWDAETCDGR